MRRETPDVRTPERGPGGERPGAPPGADEPAAPAHPATPVPDPDAELQRRWSTVVPVAQPVERVVLRVGIRSRSKEAPPR